VALSADGNTVAVGAASEGDAQAGYVRVYRLSPVSDVWSQHGSDIVGEAGTQSVSVCCAWHCQD
jgi:hypothetical protein